MLFIIYLELLFLFREKCEMKVKWQLAQKVFLVLFSSYVRIVFDIHRGHSLHSQQRQEKKSTEHYRGKSMIHCLVIWKVNRGTFVFSFHLLLILIIFIWISPSAIYRRNDWCMNWYLLVSVMSNTLWCYIQIMMWIC